MKTLNKPVARQSGITLIEVSIALIIAAIVAAAAFILFQQNQRRNDAQDGAAFMTTLLTETATKIGRNGGYAGLTGAVLFNSGVVSKELGTLNTTTINARGVNYYSTITAAVNATTGNGEITVNAKGREACVAMASSALNNAATVSVAGTTVTNLATASANCTDGTTAILASLAP